MKTDRAVELLYSWLCMFTSDLEGYKLFFAGFVASLSHSSVIFYDVSITQ